MLNTQTPQVQAWLAGRTAPPNLDDPWDTWIQYAEGIKWWTQPGESECGILLEYCPFSGATDYNGRPCGYLVLERTYYPCVIKLDKADLKTQIKRVQPHVGDILTIQYIGDKLLKRGRKMKIFRVTSEINFDVNVQEKIDHWVNKAFLPNEQIP